MDVREKLVDLIVDAKRTDQETGSFTEYLADYLIANGVTVQEWVSCKDRLPEETGNVLAIVSGNPRKNITLDHAYELSEYDPDEGWIIEMWPEWEDAVVTYWMPLPEPPKGTLRAFLERTKLR